MSGSAGSGLGQRAVGQHHKFAATTCRKRQRALHIIDYLFKFNIPFACQHPKNHFLWNTPEFLAFASGVNTHSVTLDHRASEVRWRKIGTLVFTVVSPPQALRVHPKSLLLPNTVKGTANYLLDPRNVFPPAPPSKWLVSSVPQQINCKSFHHCGEFRRNGRYSVRPRPVQLGCRAGFVDKPWHAGATAS